MFEIGWSEILVVAIVAIVVIGPKDLPRVMRTVGQWAGKMKRMGREFQNQFQEALREAELDDVRKDIADIMATDPLKDVKTEMSKVESGLKTELDKTAETVAAAATPAETPPVAAEPTPVAVEAPPATEPVLATAANEPEPAAVAKAVP